MSWNKPTMDSNSGKQFVQKAFPLKSLLILLVAPIFVVGLGAIICFLFKNNKNRASIHDENSIKSAPLCNIAFNHNTYEPISNHTDKTKESHIDSQTSKLKFTPKIPTATNPHPAQHELPPPPEGCPIFKTAGENLVALILSNDGTRELPPFPMLSERDQRDFREALEKNKIEISDDETDEVQNLKRAMIETRKELIELIDSGLSLNTILKEHQELVNSNYEIRSQAYREAYNIFHSGDVQGCHEYLLKINVALQQMGIRSISVPGVDGKPIKTRAQLIEERRMIRESLLKEVKK